MTGWVNSQLFTPNLWVQKCDDDDDDDDTKDVKSQRELSGSIEETLT